MSKPNKEGWIRHRGGKCPVDKYELVDYRMRDGEVMTREAGALDWSHGGSAGDILSYRLHKPEQVEPSADGYTYRTLEEWTKIKQDKAKQIEPAVVDNVEAFNARAEMPAAKYFDGPLQWRDRIREIDSTVEALEEERVSLVQKLEAEGFRLIGAGKPDNASIASAIADQARGYYSEPAEDMSDWRNWKAGDLVERISDAHENIYKKGQRYEVIGFKERGPMISDECGEGSYCVADSEVALARFKWHSRPSA